MTGNVIVGEKTIGLIHADIVTKLGEVFECISSETRFGDELGKWMAVEERLTRKNFRQDRSNGSAIDIRKGLKIFSFCSVYDTSSPIFIKLLLSA